MGGGDAGATTRPTLSLLEMLADRVPAMLGYWDRDCRCRYANQAYLRWFGRSPETLLGHHIKDLLGPLYEPNLPYIEGALSGVEQEFEREIPDPQGGPPRFSVANYVPDLVDGRVQGFFVLVTDVTFARRAEAAERKLERLAAERLDALSALAAGLSHELNNPLAANLANLDFLLAELDRGPLTTATARAPLLEARAASERVAAVAQGMRLLGRGRRDGAVLVNVDLALTDALELAAHAWRFRARLQSNLEARCLVLGDLAQLTQAFVHLLTNAALALPEGQPTTNLLRVTSRRVGDQVELTFEDNGPGISDELRPHVFEPFFTTRRAAGHVGLGLPICRAVVEAFGGTLALDSTPGKGCTVRVGFPVAGELAAPTAVAPVTPVAPGPVGPRPTRPTVFVIDDEAMVASSVRRMLKRDYAVEVMTDAEAAVSHLTTCPDYDVVLCDLMMPRVTGAELYLATVERHPQLRNRFVFMTGGTYTDSIREFLARTHVPVIDKPFDLERLRALLEACVTQKPPGG